MRKHLSKWHRRAGIFAALIAIYLSITGLMLNHSHDLKLDTIHTNSTLLLNLYGIKTPNGMNINTEKHAITKMGETLFFDEQIIGQYKSALSGAIELDQLLVIAMTDTLLMMTNDGEIIDRQTINNGLPGRIDSIATIDDLVLIVSGEQRYLSDRDFLQWQFISNSQSLPGRNKPEPLNAASTEKFATMLPGYGPSWERVLQDLHSGRFFKFPGTLLIDLTGIILLLLSISGIMSFSLRRKAIRSKAGGRA